jgi:hypothetical protein
MSTDHHCNPAGSRRREATPLAVRSGSPEGEASAFAANTPDFDAQLAGRFHATAIVRHRPRTLGTWRVTTASPPAADRIVRPLGGHVHQDPTTARFEVVTAAATVGILLDGPESLRVGWHDGPDSSCDGATQGDGRPCACPAGLAARRAAAKRGHGCRPGAEVRFALADDPAAGVFAFASEDWSFVEQASVVREVLDRCSVPVRARLGLGRTLHTLRSGKVLACTQPVIALVGRRP